jgi:hypothetical protein
MKQEYLHLNNANKKVYSLLVTALAGNCNNTNISRKIYDTGL